MECKEMEVDYIDIDGLRNNILTLSYHIEENTKIQKELNKNMVTLLTDISNKLNSIDCTLDEQLKEIDKTLYRMIRD